MYISQQKASMAAEALLERICPIFWIMQLQQTTIYSTTYMPDTCEVPYRYKLALSDEKLLSLNVVHFPLSQHSGFPDS